MGCRFRRRRGQNPRRFCLGWFRREVQINGVCAAVKVEAGRTLTINMGNGNDIVRFNNYANGGAFVLLTGVQTDVMDVANDVRAFQVSPDGKHLATESEGRTDIYSLD